MPRHTFHDLATVVDELHALVDAWSEADAFAPEMDADGMEVLRLVLHEWIANLVQHAVFPGAVEIGLDVQREPGGALCVLDDTSAGFDFLAQLDQQRSLLDGPGPSERGRGLLMLVTCTDDLDYTPAGDGTRQRVAFRVHPPVDETTMLAGLFRPDDLTVEPPTQGDGAPSYRDLSALPPGGLGRAPHPAAPRR